MATKPLTSDRNSLNGAVVFSWAGMGSADNGTPIAIPYAAAMSVQVSGTFDGATCVLEGSNDGTNWYTLNSRAVTGGGSVSLSMTSAGLRSVLEQPAYIRPKTSGGGAGTELAVTLVVRAEYAKAGY